MDDFTCVCRKKVVPLQRHVIETFINMKKIFSLFAILVLTLCPYGVVSSYAETQDDVTIVLSTGILDCPTYLMNTFTVKGENDTYEVCLYFSKQLGSGNYTSNLSTDVSQSYIQVKGGVKKEISRVTKATVTYLGDALRAVKVEATLSMTDGTTYKITIYTNEEENYATFEEDLYNKYPIEGSWRYGMDLKLANNPNNVLNGFDASAAYTYRQNDHLIKWYTSLQGSSRYENFHVQLQIFPKEGGSGIIPSGVYPVNSTGEPGTVFIGALPEGDYYATPYLIYEQNSYQTGCGSFFHYEIESDTIKDPRYTDYNYLHRFDYVLRSGYVEVYNKNEAYIIHVHAYADAYHSTGKGVVDFYINGINDSQDPAEFIPSDWDAIVGTQTDEGNDDEEQEETVVTKDVYQNGTGAGDYKLFDLAPVTVDGITYTPIDMGNGLAWCDRNIGAKTPQDAGTYFYFGDTEGHTSFSDKQYYEGVKTMHKFWHNLPADADAATQILGLGWRMPTFAEIGLLTNTNYQILSGSPWISTESYYFGVSYSGDDDTGYTYTCDEDNSRSIFIPAVNFYSSELTTYKRPYVWTATMGTDAVTDGKYPYYNCSGIIFTGKSWQGQYCYYGLPIRPVFDLTGYTLTIKIKGTNTEYTYTCAAGQKITINPIAESGYSFDKWYYSDGTTPVTNDPNVNGNTFTITGDATYYALFTNGSTPVDPPVVDPSGSSERDIYQNVTTTTTTILYNLDEVRGDDGLTYKPVDMGYGIAWADRNVGATSPEDIGDYFRWGDPIVPSRYYDEINTSGMYDGYVLPSYMDIATVNMGSCWRMPTDDEQVELRDNSLISNNNTFTNKADATKYIILPAGGYKGYQATYDQDYQYYWSSVFKRYSGANCAWNLQRDGYNSYAVNVADKDVRYKMEIYYGLPVRAIYVPNFTVYTLTINVGTKQYVYKCQAGQELTITAHANTNYMFDKWTDNNATEATRVFTMNSDITTTATFRKAQTQTTISFNANGGTGGQTTSVLATKGSAMPAITAVPTRTGYTFLGYFDATTGGTKYYNADKSSAKNWDKDVTSVTLYAQWSINSYTIIFQNEDGTELQKTQEQYGATPYYTGYTPTKEPTDKYTYTHDGWTPTISAVVGDQIYTATYYATEIEQYTVTLHGSMGGIISVNDGVTTYTNEALDFDEEKSLHFAPGTTLNLSLISNRPTNGWGG